MQEQMLGGKGFLVIGYLLEKVGQCFKMIQIFFSLCFLSFCHFYGGQL